MGGVGLPANKPDTTLLAFTCSVMQHGLEHGAFSLSAPLNVRASIALGVLASVLGMAIDQAVIVQFAQVPGIWEWATYAAKVHEMGALDKSADAGAWSKSSEGEAL